MKESISIERIDYLSSCLSKSLLKTLELSKESRVFGGNEEKLFILHILRYINDGDINFDNKVISNYKNGGLKTFYDVYSNAIKNRKNFLKVIYRLIKIKPFLHIKSIFNILFAPVIVSFDQAPYCKKNVVLNLSVYFLRFIRPSKKLRNKFIKNLIEVGLNEDLAKIFSWHFPRSHLEGFKFFRYISSKCNEKKIILSNIYVCQHDPIVSFLSMNKSTRLIYIQHGGGYGFNEDRIDYQIEYNGASKMLFWGSGDQNVFQTRFRYKNFLNSKNTVSLITSMRFTSKEKIKTYENVFSSLKGCSQSNNFKICVYPSFKNSIKSKDINISYGITNRAHEQNKIVIYDSIGSTLLFSRLSMRKPFLVIDNFPVKYQSDNAKKMINLFYDAGVLIKENQLHDELKKLLEVNSHELEYFFNKRTQKLLNYFHSLPKIEILIDNELKRFE
tara:strand:+ start:25364 stop:26695 length:1332 start_codon:yes stop_codon:yes gene_type:complete